ncbi:MAG: Gfo/Idh/MocA family oxidoreductase [Anaerolineae bacterium]
MAEPIHWGIMGTGSIAAAFAADLALLPDARLAAVGSRTQAGADAFAERFGIPHRHASYEALAADPTVDVIYVATPHPQHHPNTLLCLEAGKAVLCEKPFALNAAQAAGMIALARARGLFLMDAMWTRFLPLFARLRELLAEEALGAVQMLGADFGFRADFAPHSRLFDPALGGGALLDVGVYPVALASQVLGPPARIAALAHIGKTGVDEGVGIVLGCEGGTLAVLSASLRADAAREAWIAGTHGRVLIRPAWWMGSHMTLIREGHSAEEIDLPPLGRGYTHEAAEVMACLRAGRTESPVMPLDETLAIMQTLDTVRAQIGLRYPGEA